MTIIQVMEKMELTGMLRMMVRGLLAARCPGLLEAQLNIIIDREAEVVTLQADGETIIVQTFGEVEALINSEKKGESAVIPGQHPD